jgi:cytochrome b subunit of formate dehydrogenase
MRDLQDLGDVFLYNLGFSESRPAFGKFNYVEKIEYFAFLWGTAVMGASGLLLWSNSFALRHFPKWVLDAATALHFYEAILATVSILIWHLYTVIFDPDVYPMDRAWLTGKTSADHLRHTRPPYYSELRGRKENARQEPTAEAEAPSAPEETQHEDPPK